MKGDRLVTYTTGQVAKVCGISIQSVIRSIDGGALPGFRIPGSRFRRVTRQSLLAFMRERGIPLDAIGPLSAEEAEAEAEARRRVPISEPPCDAPHDDPPAWGGARPDGRDGAG